MAERMIRVEEFMGQKTAQSEPRTRQRLEGFSTV